MTDDKLPTGPADDRDRLPARQDPNVSRALAHDRGGGALSVDLLDDRREADPDEIDLLAYWHILVKRRRLIAGVLAGVVAIALLLTLMTQPQYRASALMQVEKEGPPIVASQGAMPFYDGWDPEFLTTQYELLRSRALAERVANELNLSAQTLQGLNDPGWLGRVIALLRPVPAAAAEDANRPQSSEALLQEATGVIQGGLSVDPIKESRLVRLSFDSPDPAFSVRVVNAVAEGFIASSLERRMGTTSYAKTYLQDQLAQTKAKLEESERKLVEFAQQEGLVNTGSEGTSLATQNLTELNGLLAAAQSERIRAQSRWRQASGGGALPADMLGTSSVGALQQQRAGLQGQYQQKLQTFKPDYPEMVQLKAQIEASNRRSAGRDGPPARLGQGRVRCRDADRKACSRRRSPTCAREALDVDSRSIQYNILKREVDTNRADCTTACCSASRKSAWPATCAPTTSRSSTAPSRASRFKPNLFKNLAIGLLAGLLLGILLAFVLEFLDDTLKTPEDLEQKLRLAVLGVIPKLGPKQNLTEVSADPRSAFSEAYRSVRTALQFATDHGVPRSLLVTSPAPSEGKSTTALALARNFAQLGKRVLLIEADLRNPSLHRTLSIKSEAGLSNLLSGANGLGDVTLATDEERLSVILAGPLPPNPAELLSGSKFVSMLTVACERYDQVIIDGPPVLGLADSPILSNAVEGTLLVITSGKTRIATAQQALKRLLAARGRIVGALLTKYDAKAAGYGYHYSYDGYYAYGNKPRLTRG